MDKIKLTQEVLKRRKELMSFSQIGLALGITKGSAYFLWKTAQQSIPQELTSQGSVRKLPKTLQFNIIERFLQGTELENFWENYKKNTKTIGQNREAILSQVLLKEDLKLVKLYITDFTTPIQELAKREGITIAGFYSKVMRTSVKILAQHPEVLDQILTSAQ